MACPCPQRSGTQTRETNPDGRSSWDHRPSRARHRDGWVREEHVLASAVGEDRLAGIHLDLYQWGPGWVRPSEEEWRAAQRRVLAGNAWIADGNDLDTLELRLERADTVVMLETPWWTCAARAFRRGLSKPVGEMPEGCEDSVWRRLRDEWGLVGISCATAGPRSNAVARSSRGTGDMQRRTCSVRSEQPGRSSTAWAATDSAIRDPLSQRSVPAPPIDSASVLPSTLAIGWPVLDRFRFGDSFAISRTGCSSRSASWSGRCC